jgi:hypothetical protein
MATFQEKAPPLALASDPVNIPADVLQFCKQRRLLKQLNLAIQLATEIFRPIHGVAVRLQFDPDSDECRAVIDVLVAGEIEDVLQRNQEFTTRWMITGAVRSNDQIRVLYQFA